MDAKLWSTCPGSHQKPNAVSSFVFARLKDHDNGPAGEARRRRTRFTLRPAADVRTAYDHGSVRTVCGLSGLRHPGDLASTPPASRAESLIQLAIPGISRFPTITFAGNGSLAIACALSWNRRTLFEHRFRPARECISAAAGKPYPRLFADRIAKPLGLRDTTLSPTPGECARLLIGARNEGPCSDTTAAEGSGGRTRPRTHYALAPIPARSARRPHAHVRRTCDVYPSLATPLDSGLAHAGVPTGIGLGWVHINQPDDPAMIIEKTGGGASYTTYIALVPAAHWHLRRSYRRQR